MNISWGKTAKSPSFEAAPTICFLSAFNIVKSSLGDGATRLWDSAFNFGATDMLHKTLPYSMLYMFFICLGFLIKGLELYFEIF